MITVSIFINGNPIITRSARNVGTIEEITQYSVDDGSVLFHKRSDGPVVLAKKMLDTVKELK